MRGGYDKVYEIGESMRKKKIRQMKYSSSIESFLSMFHTKTLTKWIFIFRMMKQALRFTLMFWIVWIGLAVITLINSISYLTLVLFVKMVYLSLGFAVISTVIITVPFYLYGIAMFFYIKKQERYFNFKFSEEMEKENITSIPYKSKIWYINEEFPMMIAVRKDYIKSIENVKYSKSRTRTGSTIGSGKVTLITVDGKKIKYYGSIIGIREFVKWLSFQSHVK